MQLEAPGDEAADEESGTQPSADTPNEDPLALLLGAELRELLKVLTATAEGDSLQPQEMMTAAVGGAFSSAGEAYAYAYDVGYDEGLGEGVQ